MVLLHNVRDTRHFEPDLGITNALTNNNPFFVVPVDGLEEERLTMKKKNSMAYARATAILYDALKEGSCEPYVRAFRLTVAGAVSPPDVIRLGWRSFLVFQRSMVRIQLGRHIHAFADLR